MAIQLNESRGDKKREALLDPAYTGDLERGMVMVYTGNMTATGEQLVAPSAGTATEKVAGLLWLSEITQVDVPTIELADVPASPPYTVTVRETPLASSERVVRTDTAAVLVNGVDYTIAGRVFTFIAAHAGKPVSITYRFAISAAELSRRGGRRSVNQGAERLFNQVTLYYGKIRPLISNFVTSDGFDPVTNKVVKTAAAGKVATTGVGATIGQVFQSPIMKLSPGLNQAFVGVEFDIPLSA